jgi:UDP-glucuronate decarboxylase
MVRVDLLESGGRDSLVDVPIHQLEDKTIMITGASGIIGTHFLYALNSIQRELGIRVKVIALVNREIPKHLALLSKENSIEFLVGDLAVESFVCNLPEADLIIHAATYGQPGMFLEHPEITIKLNTYVTLTLFERVLTKNGKFLFISTSEIYSGLLNPPFFETQIGTTTPNHPRACYIEAKRCGEAIVNVYRKKGYDAKSARLSLAYGPGTRSGDRRVLNNFIEKAFVEKEIRLLDKGNARRTYCYVSDAVNMMWRILLEGKECVYNVAGCSTVTIAELARLVGEIAGVHVVFPDKEADSISGAPEDVRLDISRFSSEFGKREFIDLERGLKNTLDWQRSLYLKN